MKRNDKYNEFYANKPTGGVCTIHYYLSGRDFYKRLTNELGSEAAASNYLNKLGYVGITMPTNYLHGNNTDGKRNYVIFNPNDVKIIKKTRF